MTQVGCSALALVTLAVVAGCAAVPVDEATLELAIAPYEVPAGSEMLRCQEMALPGDADVDIDRITWAFSKGNHHVHVYVSADGESGAQGGAYDCFQAVDFTKWSLLAATQSPAADWTLPAGVAIHLRARQSLLVQTHYLNTTSSADQPFVASGSVIFGLAAPGTTQKHTAAFFAENRDIHVPPHEQRLVEGECELPEGGRILAMLGHHHGHGRKFEAWLRPEGGAPVTVYESEDFSLPLWHTFASLPFAAHDRLGWSCAYDNPGSEPVDFGPLDATQEHCNLFAFYTLDQGEPTLPPCVIGEGQAP